MTAHPQHTLRLGDWNTLNEDAKAIRFEVFVEEQKVPAELEMDHMDAVCVHAVAYDAAGTPIGT
ncbi:MAG TPA: GNAT family N-acetyltransferase, partial [Duganella sp.]